MLYLKTKSAEKSTVIVKKTGGLALESRLIDGQLLVRRDKFVGREKKCSAYISFRYNIIRNQRGKSRCICIMN